MKPRRLVHRGVVDASGLLFDTAVLGHKAQQRVMACWDPASTVHEVAGGWFLRFGRDRRIRSETAPGTVVVTLAGRLATTALEADELEQFATGRHQIITVAGAIAHAAPLSDPIDIATWLDVSGFEDVQVASLGAPPPTPEAIAERRAVDVRQVLGGTVGPASEAQLAFRRKLAAAASAVEAGPRQGGSTAGAGTDAPGWLAGMLDRLQSWLRSIRAERAKSPRGPPPKSTGQDLVPPTGSTAPAAPKGPNWLDRLIERTQWALAKLAHRLQLSKMLGRKHAEYLSDLMRMFEDGDLDAALRHAIPLSDRPDGTPAPPRLGGLSPRSSLDISMGGRSVSSSLVLGPDLFQQLRDYYRRAFERLDAADRVEEAAFVLAELLEQDLEAVAYLERRGKPVKAAELAEARDLPAGLIVRQWIVAGDWRRAIEVARRTGTYADALTRLEKTHPEAAKKLRLVWGETLAESGEYAKAVEVVWPILEARPLAKKWIEQAIADGGPMGVMMLVRGVVLAPELFTAVRDRLVTLLGDVSSDRASDRLVLADALIATPPTELTRVLARPAARALMRDLGAHRVAVSRSTIDQLVKVAADESLRADIPPMPQVKLRFLADRADPVRVLLPLEDTGSIAVSCAVHLPSGDFLVALGEAGLRLVRPDGRTVRHFDEPAHDLVVSDRGNRAITIAPRGRATRLARVDIGRWKLTPWCEGRISHAYAPTFDGERWFVGAADGDGVEMIDATAKRLKSLWRVGDVRPARIERSDAKLAICALTAEGVEIFDYELPSLTLRRRAPWDVDGESPVAHAITSAGAAALLFVESHNRLRVRVEGRQGPPATIDLAEDVEAVQIGLTPSWLIISARGQERCYVELYDLVTLRSRAEIALDGSERCSVRATLDTVTIADDRGRVVLFDLRHGRLLRSLRIHA